MLCKSYFVNDSMVIDFICQFVGLCFNCIIVFELNYLFQGKCILLVYVWIYYYMCEAHPWNNSCYLCSAHGSPVRWWMVRHLLSLNTIAAITSKLFHSVSNLPKQKILFRTQPWGLIYKTLRRIHTKYLRRYKWGNVRTSQNIVILNNLAYACQCAISFYKSPINFSM